MTETDTRGHTIWVYRDDADEWRWQWIAANGEVIADSGEGYVNRQDCVDIAAAIIESTPTITVDDE